MKNPILAMISTIIFIASCFWLVTANELIAVGKNKTAKMSTMIHNSAAPATINDGVTTGAALIHTASGDTLPWAMLDMEQPYLVLSVRVWNRLDSVTPQRFSKTSIGLSNNPMVWTAFNKDLFDLCFYYTDVPTAADNPININCYAPVLGRYLAVYKNSSSGTPDFLHIFEIDVFAMAKEAYSVYVNNAQPSFSAASSTLLGQRSLASLSKCLIICKLQPGCQSALFIRGQQQCQLFGSVAMPTSFISSNNFYCPEC